MPDMPTLSALCVISNVTCITIIPAFPYFTDMVMGKYSHLFPRFVRGGFFKERTGFHNNNKNLRDESSTVSNISVSMGPNSFLYAGQP